MSTKHDRIRAYVEQNAHVKKIDVARKFDISDRMLRRILTGNHKIKTTVRTSTNHTGYSVYLLKSNLCNAFYVGITRRSVQERHREHTSIPGAHNVFRESSCTCVADNMTEEEARLVEPLLVRAMIAIGFNMVNKQYGDYFRVQNEWIDALRLAQQAQERVRRKARAERAPDDILW